MTSEVGILAAFAAGLVSFLSPCVLPLVPGYVSYVSGNKLASHRMRGRASSLLLSLVFVLGFSTIFVALGATATALSRLLFAYRFEASVAGGAVVAMFDVFLTGLVRLPLLERDMRFHGAIPGGRPALICSVSRSASGGPALSHQPFLLLTTCLNTRLGFNKFNCLARRQGAAREPFLARYDNAVPTRSSRDTF
jgi:cytochrome c biogenesis protein CcdA